MSLTIIQRHPYCWYGLNPGKPILPKGWRYFERENDWLLAQSPDGEYWFAGETHLCRLRFATEWDVIRTQIRSWFNKWATPFEEGDIYSDARETIEIASLV